MIHTVQCQAPVQAFQVPGPQLPVTQYSVRVHSHSLQGTLILAGSPSLSQRVKQITAKLQLEGDPRPTLALPSGRISDFKGISFQVMTVSARPSRQLTFFRCRGKRSS